MPVVLGSAFALFGLFVGVEGVLWAEIVPALALREAVFGLAQLVPVLVSIVVMLAGGPLCARAGKKGVVLLSLACLGGAALMLGRAGGLATFLAALALQGAGFGGLETAVNGAILEWERMTGRPAMNLMHAGFSSGAVGGALGTGLLLEGGVTYPHVFDLLALGAGVIAMVTLAGRYPPEDRRGAGGAPDAAGLRLVAGDRVLRGLALIAVLGLVGESVANTWAVLYLRGLGARAVVGGSALALVNGAVVAGRLMNAAFVARVGPRASLLASGGALVLAAALLLVPGGVVPAVASFVVLGLAVAGIVPTVLGAAAPRAPGQSGALSGAIMAAGYVGFILAPPLVGGVAELGSLRLALLSVGLAGLGILWLARRLPEARDGQQGGSLPRGLR